MNPYQDKLDPWSSHSIITRPLLDFSPGTRILDVGTASGTLGKLVAGKGFILEGIEPMEAWAEQSRPYYAELRVQDLEHAADSFLAGHQVVVCGDVLEHMPDPQAQLLRLARLQPPGALFIISLPNVANLWVRLHLLMGHFDYADRGILDRTHLRFFTLKTARQMLEACGLEIQRITPTTLPLSLVSPFFQRSRLGRSLHRMLAALTSLLPTLLGYQFIFEARTLKQKGSAS